MPEKVFKKGKQGNMKSPFNNILAAALTFLVILTATTASSQEECDW